MRPVGLVVVLVAAVGHAADGTLATGASHEVVWTPPSLVPIRGPRFAPVTLDAYVHCSTRSRTPAPSRRAAGSSAPPTCAPSCTCRRTARHAELAMEALLEAADEGRFYPLFDRLLQSRVSVATAADLGRLGREAGLDGERLDEALASHRHRADVERLQSEARDADHHAPELLVNGRRLSPWSGDETIGRAIADARARAEELLADGVPLSQLYDRIVELDEEVPFAIDPLARGTHKRLTIDLGGAPDRGPGGGAGHRRGLGELRLHAVRGRRRRRSARIDQAHPGLVRVAWKHYPSPYRAAIGETAAEYAAAAAAQGRFWPLYDLAMASHLLPARVSRLRARSPGARGPASTPPRSRASSPAAGARAAVERDTDEARRLGVPTAGSVAVNGIPVAGAPSYELLERLVAERARRRRPRAPPPSLMAPRLRRR